MCWGLSAARRLEQINPHFENSLSLATEDYLWMEFGTLNLKEKIEKNRDVDFFFTIVDTFRFF